LKLRKEDIQSISEEPLQLFYQGIKSPVTKEKYTRTLKRILCDVLEDILTGTFEERAAQFVNRSKSDPAWAMGVLLSISKKLRDRTELQKTDKDYLSPNSFSRYFKPIKKLLDMNEVPIAWKRVYSTFPESNNGNSGRGYTREEIQRMMIFTNGAIEKAIILVASSSGIRLGGFGLTWDDVKPVYKLDDKITFDVTESEIEKAQVVCAMFTVYKGTSDEYPGFITPEAYQALQDYRTSWIKEMGKEPRPTDPLFKKEGPFIIPLTSNAVKSRMEEVLKRAGLRTPLVIGKRRHEVPVMNGFRRFFNKVNKETLSKDSPLAALIKKEFQMGHIGLVKLDRNYFQAHISELVEEYLNAVPNLTINNDARDKIKIAKLETELSEKEKKDDEILRLRQSVEYLLSKDPEAKKNLGIPEAQNGNQKSN
jgi:hypothetical protein